MPDYSTIYKHGLSATDPLTGQEITGPLDPEKRYNLDFTSMAVESPTQQQFQQALANEQQQTQMPKMPEWDENADINELAKNDYKTGQLNAQNEYLEEMNTIAPLWDKMISPQPPEQYVMLSQLAAQKLMAKNAELNAKKQQWENVYGTTNKDPRYGPREKRELQTDWYVTQKHRIFEPSDVKMPTGEKPPSLSDKLTMATGLRKEFNQSKVYDNFITLQRAEAGMYQAYQLSLKTDSKSRVASDQALAVLFQKMLDPESVVRESEYARTPEGVSALSRIKSYLPKLRKGGMAISDFDRKALYEMGQRLLIESKKTMNQHIINYEQLAVDYGVEPRLVLGNLKPFDLQATAERTNAVDKIAAEEGF